MLKEYAREFGLRTLVETGTYYGDMVEALKMDFDQIYSIELSPTLHAYAKRRFEASPHIELLQGDSGVLLGSVLNRLRQPALFWLDGHYSQGETARGDLDTPILEELRQILDADSLPHVVIIDDARCFGLDPSYPSLDQVASMVRYRRAAAQFTVKNDSIRIILK